MCSIAGTERDSVVTTVNLPATRLAMWNAASPMPTTGASVEAARGVEAGVVEAGDDAGVDADGAFCISPIRPGIANTSSIVALDARRAVDRD